MPLTTNLLLDCWSLDSWAAPWQTFLRFGAIGSEKEPTANLVPALMAIAASVVLSTVSMLAAFEVLAKIYLPSSADCSCRC